MRLTGEAWIPMGQKRGIGGCDGGQALCTVRLDTDIGDNGRDDGEATYHENPWHKKAGDAPCTMIPKRVRGIKGRCYGGCGYEGRLIVWGSRGAYAAYNGQD